VYNMRGPLEVEQKFRVQDLARVQRQVTAQGAAFASSVEQVDRYYAHPVRDFGQTDEALRIRRVGTANLITYKGPKLDPQTKTRREIELALPPGDEAFSQIASLLEALGFRVVAGVRKQRRVAQLQWRGFPIEVALDEVDGLGQFVELETAADEAQLEDAKSAVGSLGQFLGLQGNERRSYLELLLLSRAKP
jgi:adenylate cyclase class 2